MSMIRAISWTAFLQPDRRQLAARQSKKEEQVATNDIVTLLIAVYAAAIATVLAVREIRRDRRRIRIALEHVAFYERVQTTVTNSGFRPITITEIGMAVGEDQNGKVYWDPVPRNALFAPEVDVELLPAALEDGEPLSILLSDEISRNLFHNEMRAKVSVYDAEGTVYTDFRTRIHNPKWGYYRDT
jgi:hypothetical protein